MDGKSLYEKWLTMRDVSPDDLWEHLDPEQQIAWDGLAAFVAVTEAEVDHLRDALRTISRAAGDPLPATLAEASAFAARAVGSSVDRVPEYA